MSAGTPLEGLVEPTEQQRITDAVQAISDSRALIEQTKGMLMFVYGIDADAAFDILKMQSQTHNVKLRVLAESIQRDLVELTRAKGTAHRQFVAGLVLTAHQRITQDVAREPSGR